MRIDVLTLFPEMLLGLKSSIVGRAVQNQIIDIRIHDFRTFSKDKHKRVDDYSYGGGAGMIISAQPIVDCIRSIQNYKEARKILLSPSGKVFNQERAVTLVNEESHIIFICGHYEGIDYRIYNYIDEVLSIGDYVLSAGENAALVIVDCIVRLIPGVLGNEGSHAVESFDNNLLEYPQYTRPQVFEGLEVPPILMSGNHERIRQYRRFKSIEQTYLYRPDLLLKTKLTEEDEQFLIKIKKEKTFEE